MTQKTRMEYCDAARTAQLLPFPALIEEVARAAVDLAVGAIRAPARQVVSFPTPGCVMLSMPATAPDVSIHKLVNVVPPNRARGRATINGVVSVYSSDTGELQLLLDGPTVTTRRTAAVSMLGLRRLSSVAPRRAVVFGTGVQAAGHLAALRELYPDLLIGVAGHTAASACAFVRAQADARVSVVDHVDAGVDLVITATTSANPVYDEAPLPERLVIGVGAYRPDLAEIGPRTLAGSRLCVDDLDAAREEAGDFLQARVDWASVVPLADLPEAGAGSGPAVFKTVGSAAWDLAAARCALHSAEGGRRHV